MRHCRSHLISIGVLHQLVVVLNLARVTFIHKGLRHLLLLLNSGIVVDIVVT